MLDALNRRRKFVGRQPTGQRIDLTARDLAYFAALERHGPLDAPTLFEFAKNLAVNERGHKDRLTALYHETKTAHGGAYLERPEQQFARLDARCRPMVYELTHASQKALREAGIPLQAAMPPSGPYQHRFLAAVITASVELDAIARGLRFISSGDILRHPKCPETTRNAANPLAIRAAGRVIIPDALYGIDYGGKFRFWALEADRGTEPLKGRGRASRYIFDKIDAYQAVMKTEAYRHTWGIPILAVRIVCESALRAENISTLIKRNVKDSALAAKFAVECWTEKTPGEPGI
jgi:hypothetical protein